MTARRKQRARAIADLEQGLILARVEIAAPPERVFRALTTDELAQWWGSTQTYRTTKHTIDLRVGGAWRSEGVGERGPFHVGGTVLEVDPPRKLVQTWEPSWNPGAPTTVAYLLDAIDGGTRLTVRHAGFTDAAQCGDHATGWERVLGWLDAFAGSATRYFLCRLLPPRATFMQDMSADERTVMLAHGAYWQGKLAEGAVVAFGPVADPAGGWGLGLVAAADEAELQAMQAADPAITSGIGLRYETIPMVRLIH